MRARLVARGFEEEEIVHKDSPTVGKSTLRVIMTVTASKKWIPKTTDIKSACLQGNKLETTIHLKPPR